MLKWRRDGRGGMPWPFSVGLSAPPEWQAIAVNQMRIFEREKETRKVIARQDANLQPDRYERWTGDENSYFPAVFVCSEPC